MTVNSKIFSISTLNTIEHGPLTLNIKPHLDPHMNCPLEKQIQLICTASIKILCSDVLRALGLIRELKAFKFEHAALVLDFKGSLSLGHTVL